MSEKPHSKRAPKRSDPRALGRFLQELSWLLNSYSDLDFKALEGLALQPTPVVANTSKRKGERLGTKTNVHTLVGVLPGLFVDERLFPTNEDISEFAVSALGVHIPRWQKKSKFELIGHIVCTANALEEEQVASLVDALSRITGEDTARLKIEGQRQRGLSWNEVIQGLLAEG